MFHFFQQFKNLFSIERLMLNERVPTKFEMTFQSPWSLPLCPDSLKRSCLPPWMATSLMQAHLLSGSFGHTAFRTQPFTTPSTYWVANHATNAYASPWRWSGIGIDCDCQWQTICNATGNNWICIKHMTIVSLPILHLPALHSLGPLCHFMHSCYTNSGAFGCGRGGARIRTSTVARQGLATGCLMAP